jgi:hypothetical protein
MKRSSTKPGTPEIVNSRIRFRDLVLAAALHIAVTGIALMVGRFELMPSQFDLNGLASFAGDGFMYQSEVIELSSVLKQQGLVAWATWPTQLHVRLYSLPVVMLGGGNNLNILRIEPLNLLYYLAILALVFKLGEVVFNYRTGRLAAATVALWPSFLLHTTQLLRDPLLVAAVLTLVLSLTLSLKQNYSWWRGALIGVAGSAAIVLIRIVRLPMWDMLWLIVVGAILLLLVRSVHQRRFAYGNIAFAIMILATMITTPHFQDAFHNQQVVKSPRIIVPEEIQKLSPEEQMAARRHAFKLRLDSSGEATPSEAGSDIDREVEFNGPTDIIRHIPRAMVLGFLAPFPNMWFAAGKQVGSRGRLLAGFETLVSYMIECLALFGLWRERRNLAAWFIFLVVTLGALGLGLVVANIGALYRLRYPFWALLIVCGASGATHLVRRRAMAAGAGNGLAVKESPGTFQS